MADFGFDPSIILANSPRPSNETFGDVFQKARQSSTENQLGQARLSDMLYGQQRQKSLADIVSQNSGAYSDPTAQALARGGFGDQAAEAEAQSTQRKMNADKLVQLHGDILRSQASTIKTPEQYDAWATRLPDEMRAQYGLPDPGKYDASAVQGFIASGMQPEKQAEYLDANRRRSALADTGSPLNQFRTGLLEKFGVNVPAGLNTGDITDQEIGTAERGQAAEDNKQWRMAATQGKSDAARARAPAPAKAPAASTDDNPYPGLKPKEIEAKWKDFRDAIGTTKARGRLTGGLQERLNSAERLEALVLGPNGDIQNLTPQQLREAATATASLIGGGGSAALGQIEELVPHTLAGQFANMKQKLLNAPQGADAQAFLQNMLDTAGREKRTTLKQMQALQLQGVPDFIGLRKLDKGRFERDLRGAKLDPTSIDDDGLMKAPASPSSAAAQGAMVSVISPEGKIGRIPTANLEAAKARGFKLAGP